MIVLHAAFCRDHLLLWAEGVTNKSGLALAVSELAWGFKLPRRLAHEAVAWLPSVDGEAVGSGSFREGAEGERRVEPQDIFAFFLDGKRAMEILALCAGKRVVTPGVLIGDDLAYWTAALRFAAGLAMRGQFLPDLVRRDEEYEARWSPVVAGPDLARFEGLAKAMPAAARALALVDEDAPSLPAQTVLLGFVGLIVDALARKGGAGPRRRDSVHDRWQEALISSDCRLSGLPGELEALAAHIENWQRPIRVAARAPFRLAFRLGEPEGEEGPWTVEYLLQGTKDPSLLLPAAKAWGKGARAAVFGTDAAALREHLLVSLGQAASISGQVEASLQHAAPEGYELDAAGAHAFLRETAGALEQSGFGVMLPRWWTRRGAQARLHARAHVKSPAMSGSGLSLDTLVEFDWKLALGGEEMSYAELRTLAKMKQPLMKVRGQWVEVNANEIQAALAFLERNPGGEMTARAAMRMAIGVDEQAGMLEVGEVTAEGWVGNLLSGLESRTPLEELPQPPELRGTLRPYQLRGFSWMEFLKRLGLGACLADDMGLGKTVQTLAMIQRDRSEGETRPVLLVCPTSVVSNWSKEAARFTPELPVLVHHGLTRSRGAAFKEAAARYAVVVSSYSLLNRDLEALGGVKWAGLILDEAQNIKNPETKQAKAARALKAGYRVALTGTPVENNVGDLWSLMEFLNPGFLGSESAFRKRFFVPIQVYADKDAAGRLKKITSPFILRRLKTDRTILADLPEKQEMKVFCNLTKEQASLYEAVVRDTRTAIERSEGIERKGLVLSTLMKLKQVCNHPAQFLKDHSAIDGRSGKLARLGEMLEETLAAGDRSLVFTQFAEMGEILQRHLQDTFGLEVLYLHGATPRAKRDEMVERFAEADGPRIFLLSLRAGGTGLNLTSANHVFHFDRWWNPAVENQATDRAFRIGQTKNVQVHKFVCAGTLEEKIDEMIERKREVAGNIVGTGEAWLSEMSNAQLRELLALRKDAVGE